MAEVSAALIEKFRQHSGDPEHREAVIVTLGPGGSVDELAKKGVAVTMSTRDGKIVAGTVNASALDAVAALDPVIRIEPEGEVHALGG